METGSRSYSLSEMDAALALMDLLRAPPKRRGLPPAKYWRPRGVTKCRRRRSEEEALAEDVRSACGRCPGFRSMLEEARATVW